MLRCRGCLGDWPIVRGVPVFTPPAAEPAHIEADLYAAWAPFNDAWRATLRREHLLRGCVLDANARTGWSAAALAALDPERKIVGVTSGKAPLPVGTVGLELPNLAWVVAPHDRPYPFVDGAFDGVHAHDLLHEAPPLLAELCRLSAGPILAPHVHCGDLEPTWRRHGRHLRRAEWAARAAHHGRSFEACAESALAQGLPDRAEPNALLCFGAEGTATPRPAASSGVTLTNPLYALDADGVHLRPEHAWLPQRHPLQAHPAALPLDPEARVAFDRGEDHPALRAAGLISVQPLDAATVDRQERFADGGPTTLWEAFDTRRADSPLFTWAEDESVFTVEVLRSLVDVVATRLRVTEGPIVVAPLRRMETLLGVLAAWRLGRTAAIAPPGETLGEVAARWGGTAVPIEDLEPLGAAEALPEPPSRPHDVALILPTSGTSGRPKGVRLSHRALLRSVRALHDGLGLTPEDRWLGALPLQTLAGIRAALLGPLCAGGAVIDPSDHPGVTAERGLRMGATMLSGAPAWLRAVASLRLPRGRPVLSVGAPLPDRGALEARLGVEVADGYGLTETAGTFTLARGSDRGVGRLLRGVLTIGADGEICFGGGSIMDGYVGEAGARWVQTGDLGRADGPFVHLEGRKDRRWSLPSGVVVVPERVEEALGVECVVVPAGTRVAVVCTAAPAPERLAEIGLPSRVVLVVALPRLPSGKVDVAAARASVEEP